MRKGLVGPVRPRRVGGRIGAVIGVLMLMGLLAPPAMAQPPTSNDPRVDLATLALGGAMVAWVLITFERGKR